MLRRQATGISIETRLTPGEALERLSTSATMVRSILLSPTWGKKEPFVLSIDGAGFAMRSRHGYSNGLARILRGSVSPSSKGARLEGEFRTLLFVVLILRGAWIAILLSVAAVWRELAREGPAGLLFALAVPVSILSFLVAIEAIARRLGDSDEREMRAHLNRLFRE